MRGDGAARAGSHGDRFEAAGLTVEAHGELHAVVHPDLPRVANVGFLIDQDLFHPGDALTLPGRAVAALVVPVLAPWTKVAEVDDWVREVDPRTTLPGHDAAAGDAELWADRLADLTSAPYLPATPGETITT